MSDYGARYTDKVIAQTEQELKRTYRQAQKELKKKLRDFESRFAEKNAEKKRLLKAGKITEQQYKDWLTGQVFIRNQWQSKIRDVSAVMHDCNKQAVNLINSRRLDVFAENYNYMAFRGEASTGISFGVYNSQSVALLIADNPQILPKWKIDEEKDYEWNEQKVNNIVRQGIIQGESIPEIADRLVTDLSAMNEHKMEMFARTAMTEAQSAGRQQQMNDAADMGIEVHKQWLATLDNRTRDAHRKLDGQEVPYNEPFDSPLGEIDYPGDPDAEDPANVYNCRCTMVTIYPKYEDRSKPDWREQETVDGMTYQEWKEGKKERLEEKRVGKITGSASGIIARTNRYNDREYSINEKIRKLDEEYSKLYTESLMKYGTSEYETIIRRMEKIEEEIAALREESVKVQADRSRYLAQGGEKEIRRAYGKIRGKHNAELDAKSVNVITSDPRTQSNCASCSLAYEARRRGIDSVARLSYGTNNGEIETWLQGLSFKTTGKRWGTDAREEIRRIATQWGEGARGFVQVDFTPMAGHTFVFEVVRGRCVFIDPQTGVINSDEIFVVALPGSVKYARTDDKELTKAAMFGMRGRKE